MNLIIIPFHDWRKSQKEGFRTRDVHFINSFYNSSEVNKILVINRPSTFLELLYKKQKRRLNGKIHIKKNGFTLTEVQENLFVVDFFSRDILTQIISKHLWFIEKYVDLMYIKFIEECREYLRMNKSYLIVQNVFSHKLACLIQAENKVFDAWDNFLKFPAYQNIKGKLELGYKDLARSVPNWITNSDENITFFQHNYSVKTIRLVKNGVKTDFVPKTNFYPEDLKKIKKPIIGFGGKISYLLNHELINYVTAEHPEKSFVFVGQILDRNIYNKIIKRNNVYFLGDKHYEEYPHYVNNFDICIIPYNINGEQHGGDSIKAYEYLLTRKKVVGTKGNGLLELSEHLYLADNKEEFSGSLEDDLNNKELMDITQHSWDSKSNIILSILKG